MSHDTTGPAAILFSRRIDSIFDSTAESAKTSDTIGFNSLWSICHCSEYRVGLRLIYRWRWLITLLDYFTLKKKKRIILLIIIIIKNPFTLVASILFFFLNRSYSYVYLYLSRTRDLFFLNKFSYIFVNEMSLETWRENWEHVRRVIKWWWERDVSYNGWKEHVRGILLYEKPDG